jgi:pimeloyl-ACP methyl ester carboxylesterase
MSLEILAVHDWLSLRLSRVYSGVGVPHGDGSPVIVVPGFLGSDRYLVTLYRWLRRIGYRPYYSGMGRNIRCPDLLVERLLRTVEQAHVDTGLRARIVGHSLGGTLARAVAARAPEKVEQVITIGSPLAFARVHPFVLAAMGIVRANARRGPARPPECYTEACDCAFVRSAGAPLPPSVRGVSIFTKRDGVVDWRCCLDETGHPNIEVRSSHLGLAFNREVYREIAHQLAGRQT